MRTEIPNLKRISLYAFK